MREIKFRAWDKRNSKMRPHDEIYMIQGDFEVDVIGENGDTICSLTEKDFELMQFIGLKDKNGKDIYEGDLIKASYLKVVHIGNPAEIQSDGIIEYDFGQFCINVGKTKSGNIRYKYFNQLFPLSPNSVQCEIIGNIHQNPELLND